VTYPNILVLDYLRRTGKSNPEILLKTQSYLNVGYQRLLTFEVPGGGFDWYGRPPAKLLLTAYALLMLRDMSRVWDVDPQLIERTVEHLVRRQHPHGSWELDTPIGTWSGLASSVPVTAFVTWALAERGEDQAAEPVRRGLAWLSDRLDEVHEPYFLALIANAFVAAQPDHPIARGLLDRLAGMARGDERTAWWENGVETITYSTGPTAKIETTALVAYAFLRANRHVDLADRAIHYLIRNKDSFGTWHSTQATILSLRAMLAALRPQAAASRGTVTVILNGEPVSRIELTPENDDVVQQVDLGPRVRLGENVVELRAEGEIHALYQVTGRYYLPWPLVPRPQRAEEPLRITVSYDKTELAAYDTITQSVRVENLSESVANMVLVDLGIPPGFQVVAEDLEEARGSRLIDRFEITGRQVILYLDALSPQRPFLLRYRLRARYPVRAQAPRAVAYEYYDPESRGEAPPVLLTVR